MDSMAVADGICMCVSVMAGVAAGVGRLYQRCDVLINYTRGQLIILGDNKLYGAVFIIGGRGKLLPRGKKNCHFSVTLLPLCHLK